MKFNTSRFGDIDVEEEEILNFVGPILGFSSEKKYILLMSSEESPFRYLQSLENEDLTFVLADPFIFYPDYEFNIDQKWLDKLELLEKEDVEIKVIATLRRGSEFTINLKAPIIFNKKNNYVAQIIIENHEFTTRFPVSIPLQQEDD